MEFGLSQTTVSPDISVIPRFRIETNDGEQLPGRRVFSRPDFTLEELEIAFQSYLNPFARADIFLTMPGPDIENTKLGIEEMYASVVRGLPLDLNLRFGKYRAEFGKLNTVHPHAWPFITTPLSLQRFLGDGLNDLGISASILLPTGDIYSRLTVDLLRGNSIADGTGIKDTTGTKPYYANSARLMGFFSLTGLSDLEVGVSTYTGIHDPYRHERFWYYNADFKYKYRPSSYTSLTIQGEYLLNTRHAWQDQNLFQFENALGLPERRTITSSGMYIYTDLQFMKIFSAGARYDWSQQPYNTADKAQAIALFFGYYPVEETLGLRLQFQHTMTEGTADNKSPVNMIGLQIIFSLGPHKAHPF